jgi:hypothetical protein
MVTITNNAVLTIQPGTTFKFGPNGGFTTTNGGAINAQGTYASPIIFTGQQQTAGSWQGVSIYSNSHNTSFFYCQFLYGGTSTRSMVEVGDPSNNTAAYASFQDVSFSNAQGNALYISATGKISILKCKFTGNGQYPISTTIESVSQIRQASNLVFGNGANGLDANGKNEIDVAGNYQVLDSVVFDKIYIPYYLHVYTGNAFWFKSNVTVKPGSVLHLAANLMLEIENTGSFNCVGTTSDSIIITGEQASAGFWDKIRFFGSSSSLNQISHTNISGGGSNSNTGWSDPGMITTPNNFGENSRFTISNCTISNSANWGIYLNYCISGGVNANGQTGAANIQSALSTANTFTSCQLGNVYTN